MNLSKKKIQNIIITLAVLLFVFVAYNFSRSLFTSVDDQTLYVSHTAINMHPPLRPLQLKKDQQLMANFSAAQATQAQLEKERIDKQPQAISTKLVFNDENLLEKNYALREYLDQWFLLYPNMSFKSMRYFIAQEISQQYPDTATAKNIFNQMDQVFIAYINLLREIETLASEDQSDAALKAKFYKIKKMRRLYLGQKTADAFYAQQEKITFEQIFNAEPAS